MSDAGAGLVDERGADRVDAAGVPRIRLHESWFVAAHARTNESAEMPRVGLGQWSKPKPFFKYFLTRPFPATTRARFQ